MKKNIGTWFGRMRTNRRDREDRKCGESTISVKEYIVDRLVMTAGVINVTFMREVRAGHSRHTTERKEMEE